MWQVRSLKAVRDRIIRRPRLLFSISLREAFSHVDVQAALTVAVALVVASATFFIIPRDDAALSGHFSPEHVVLFGMADSRPQRFAFQVFLLMIILGGLALPLLVRTVSRTKLNLKIFPLASGWLASERLKLHLILGAILLIAVLINEALGFWVLSGAAILAFAVVLGSYSRTVWIIWATTSALVIFVILPGWIGTPIPMSKLLFWWDYHYAAVLSQGERLAAGHLLYVDNAPAYSHLIPIAVGIITRLDQAMSFSELLRFTQGGQTLCFIAILTAAWLRTQDSPAPGRALAILFVVLVSAPFVSGLSPAIWTPNQSGLRFLMLPVAAIVACALGRMGPYGGSAIVGLTVGIALLYNNETGVAIAAGLGLAWLISVRSKTLRTALGSAVIGLTTMAAVFGVVAIIYHVAFGGWPFPTSREAASGLIGLFASGYGGISLKLEIPALLILVHSSYLVICAFRFLVSPHGKTPSIPNTAIAGTLLAWFPYWVNRPHDSNLWTYIVLYALLLAPAIAAQGRRLIPLTVAALLVLPMPMKFAKTDLFTPFTTERWIPGWHTGCGDGLILPPTLCAHLQSRAMVLRNWAAEGDVAWITGLPMLTMRMTGLHGTFPTIDLFNAAPTAATFDRLVRKIQEMQPRAILFDSPDDTFFGVPRQVQAFNDRLLAAIGSDGCPSRLVGGWRLVEVTDHCKKNLENN